jgi:hypothetical protein
VDDTDIIVPPDLAPTEAAAIFLRLLSPLLSDADATRSSSTVPPPSAVAMPAEGLRGVLAEQMHGEAEALRLWERKARI